MYTFYYQKSTEIEINIGMRQKQVIYLYVHLIKPPLSTEAHQKGSLKGFIPWIYFRGFTVYTKL